MPGHPVHNYAEASLMKTVDEVHEVLRRPEARSWREETCDLVTPRTGKWVFHYRQQFQMRIAEMNGVIHQLVGQLTITQIGIVRAAQPGAKMHFVDRDGRLQVVYVRARLHPRLIVPLIRVKVGNDG